MTGYTEYVEGKQYKKNKKQKMETTINIRKLIEEGYLSGGAFLDKEVLRASLEMAWKTREKNEGKEEIWNAVYNECNMSMRCTMIEIENSNDKDELLME